MITIENFICCYSKAIQDGSAAIFAGAGLSRPSGFVAWRDLLRPLAEEINLDIDKENDLTLVAQYVQNEAGNRSKINSRIIDTYNQDVKTNENVRILTKLPIETYWTTNYDHLIEEGLQTANRCIDVKTESSQLSFTKHGRDAVVYKMHGDVNYPADAVITKNDYAKYDHDRPFFRNILQGDLVSKTFLFIGFSFEDPNLDGILEQIRVLLEEDIHEHYCFMKRVSRCECENDDDYNYEITRQGLREKDLERYGIQTVFVDDYSEITDILRKIENSVRKNNIFISGSAEFYEGVWTKDKVEELAYRLAKTLVKNNHKITSGFGLGIGSSVINGALDEIYKSKNKHMDEYLCLRPFPQNIKDRSERKEKWSHYRQEFIAENGIAIFIFGNKIGNHNEKVIANGCIEEFEIAKASNCLIIPVGSTGDAAKEIYNIVKAEMEVDDSKYPYLSKHIDSLGIETDIENIISIIENIINI